MGRDGHVTPNCTINLDLYQVIGHLLESPSRSTCQAQVGLKRATLHVNRRKNGVDSVHPLRGPELRALRKLKREYPDTPYLCVTERGGSITDHPVRKILTRAGENAGIPFPVHPHMLRHCCGYKLANNGHDTRALQHYLGHKNIQHTVRYTELSPTRFKDFWKD
jgi:type 1 fimbriae regulatory protein FimE